MNYATELPEDIKTWSELLEMFKKEIGPDTETFTAVTVKYPTYAESKEFGNMLPHRIKRTYLVRFVQEKIIEELRAQVKAQSFDEGELTSLVMLVRCGLPAFYVSEDSPLLKIQNKIEKMRWELTKLSRSQPITAR